MGVALLHRLREADFELLRRLLVGPHLGRQLRRSLLVRLGLFLVLVRQCRHRLFQTVVSVPGGVFFSRRRECKGNAMGCGEDQTRLQIARQRVEM